MTKPLSRALPSLLLLLLAPSVLPGQADSSKTDTLRTLDPIVVTASKAPARASQASGAVRLISRAEISRRAAPDLAVLLRDVPGVQLDPVPGSGAGVILQGLGSDRVLILIDGAPVAGRLGGEVDLTRLDPSLFERIEIVEGPQSTLYGSTALGGVVNLLTRDDLSRRVEVTGQAGSLGHRDARLRLSEVVGGATSLSLDLGRRSVDVAPGKAPGTSGLATRWDGMARLTRHLASGRLDLRVLGGYDEQQYPSSSSWNFNDNWHADALARLELGANGGTELRGHLSWYDHRLIASANPSARDGVAEWDRQRTADLEAIHRGASGRYQWLVGGRVEREWLETERIAGGSRATWSAAPYASGEAQLGQFRLSAGLRATAAELWGTNMAPRVGLSGRTRGGVYGKLGLARGFRAPSSKELFFEYLNLGRGASYLIRGNQDLAPETSWNSTVEVGLVTSRVRLVARGFRNDLTDFIETTPAGDSAGIPIFVYRNVGQARTAGLDLGADLNAGPATLSAAWAWLDTEDESTGEPLLGRADHQVRLAAAYSPGALFVRPELVHSSRTPVSRSRTGAVTYQDPFTRVHLAAGYRALAGFDLSAGVDNLFDADPAGAFLEQGRRWFVRLTWGMGR